MDLIFKRYSSPFLFLDNLIESNDLNEGIDMIIEKEQENKDWKLYLSLNPWNDKPFSEWRKEFYKSDNSNENYLTKEQAEQQFKTEYEKSQNILNNFKPPKK